MRDLQSQVRAYAEHLDAAAPPLEELDLNRAIPALRPAPTASGRRRVIVAVAAAAAVFLVVGLSALAFRSESRPVVATSVATTSAPTALDPAPVALNVVGEAPVLSFAESADAEDLPFVGPGGVVTQDGVHHMFFNRNGEGRSRVGYATSRDLESWEVVSDALFSNEDVPYTESGVQVRTAARLPDGRWALYFDFESKVGDDQFEVAIGMATAPQPQGPWLVGDTLVLESETSVGWRTGGARHPSVVAGAGELVMYFVGLDSEGVGRIGRATSVDGIAWVPDPEPVLEATQEWERQSLTRPNVVRVGEQWIMLYAGRTTSGQGFVVSRDGVAWEQVALEAVLTTSDVVRAQIRDTELVVANDGAVRVLLENGGARTTSDVWLFEGVAR